MGEAPSSSATLMRLVRCWGSGAGEDGVRNEVSRRSEPAASQRMSMPLCSVIIYRPTDVRPVGRLQSRRLDSLGLGLFDRKKQIRGRTVLCCAVLCLPTTKTYAVRSFGTRQEEWTDAKRDRNRGGGGVPVPFCKLTPGGCLGELWGKTLEKAKDPRKRILPQIRTAHA